METYLIHRRKYDFRVKGVRNGDVKAYCLKVVTRPEATTELGILTCPECKAESIKEFESKIEILKRNTRKVTR